MKMRCPPTMPWCIKVAAGFGLIAHFTGQSLMANPLPVWFQAPYSLFLALVLSGGLINIGHYILLERALHHHNAPELLSSAGLFRWLRHPMYLGDAVLYLGFALYPTTAMTVVVYPLAAWALVAQSRREDRDLAERFGDAHAHWRSRSWLIIPGY